MIIIDATCVKNSSLAIEQIDAGKLKQQGYFKFNAYEFSTAHASHPHMLLFIQYWSNRTNANFSWQNGNSSSYPSTKVGKIQFLRTIVIH